MKTASIFLVIVSMSALSAVCDQRRQLRVLRQASLQAPQLSQSLNSAVFRAPAEHPANFLGDEHAFQFPTKRPTIAFGKFCINGRAVGSCVASLRCRSADWTASFWCRRGEVCCKVKDVIQDVTTARTTTSPPTDSGNSQQLVLNCGRPTPNVIFFPTRLQPVHDLPRTKLGPLRHRRSLLRAGVIHVAAPTMFPVNPVVGGTDVPVTSALPVGRWPWMVLLGFSENGGVEWKCGGTVISGSTILTAAHCVSKKQPNDLVVRLGEYNISSSADGHHTDARVSRIVIHPDFQRSQNDIAMLVLSQPVTFSSRIRPACLPPIDSDHTGRTADLAGWGRIGFQERTSDVLQEVSVQVVDEIDCENAYRKSGTAFDSNFPGGFQDTKICANGQDGASRDACQGDSGGPLVVQGSDERYQLIGVVSAGLGCGNPKYPGIYTKVSKYIQWIRSNGVY